MHSDARLNPRQIFGHTFAIYVTIAAIVFGLILLAVVVAMALSRRRKRAGRPTSSRAKSTPLELSYAAVVACVVGFIVFVSFRATAREGDPPGRPVATVNVHGFQWCWRFDYPGHHRTVSGTCEHGDWPTMVVPAGVPVKLRITGDDVIHSWWVPFLRYKLDAFPDHVNTVTLTIPHPGRWRGRCAEFCGLNHYSMDFFLRAVPMSQYRQWVAHGSTA